VLLVGAQESELLALRFEPITKKVGGLVGAIKPGVG